MRSCDGVGLSGWLFALAAFPPLETIPSSLHPTTARRRARSLGRLRGFPWKRNRSTRRGEDRKAEQPGEWGSSRQSELQLRSSVRRLPCLHSKPTQANPRYFGFISASRLVPHLFVSAALPPPILSSPIAAQRRPISVGASLPPRPSQLPLQSQRPLLQFNSGRPSLCSPSPRSLSFLCSPAPFLSHLTATSALPLARTHAHLPCLAALHSTAENRTPSAAPKQRSTAPWSLPSILGHSVTTSAPLPPSSGAPRLVMSNFESDAQLINWHSHSDSSPEPSA